MVNRSEVVHVDTKCPIFYKTLNTYGLYYKNDRFVMYGLHWFVYSQCK